MRRGVTWTLLAACFGATITVRADDPLSAPTPIQKTNPSPSANDDRSPRWHAGSEPIPNRLPIDLPTALRLADSANPTVAVARARVAEAYARQRQAEIYWLPTITSGGIYNRHDGQIQNTDGTIITVSKQNLFAGGGAVARVDTADAMFLPLIARRLTAAEAAAARATALNIQLDVASAYLDLLSVNAAQAINADTLARAEETQRLAESAERAGLNRTSSDVPRARTEVSLRREESIDLKSRIAVASAHLAQLLLLDPTVDLVPADPAVVPITLVPDGPLADMIVTASAYRPELAAVRALTSAAQARLRQAQVAPLLPRLEASYLAGTFGGGIDSQMANFGGRGDGAVSATWELKNLGFGNVAIARERQAQLTGANAKIVEIQAQVSAEVVAAAKTARYRLQTLGVTQQAVRQAIEMFRRLEVSSFGMATNRNQYNALEPLLAIQALNQARSHYLFEVIEYDRAQFRLYTAMGQPPLCALPGTTVPTELPANPATGKTSVIPAAPAEPR